MSSLVGGEEARCSVLSELGGRPSRSPDEDESRDASPAASSVGVAVKSPNMLNLERTAVLWTVGRSASGLEGEPFWWLR